MTTFVAGCDGSWIYHLTPCLVCSFSSEQCFLNKTYQQYFLIKPLVRLLDVYSTNLVLKDIKSFLKFPILTLCARFHSFYLSVRFMAIMVLSAYKEVLIMDMIIGLGGI